MFLIYNSSKFCPKFELEYNLIVTSEHTENLLENFIHVNVDEIRMKKYAHTLEIYNRLSETLQSIVYSHPKEYVRCKTTMLTQLAHYWIE